jgi:hypothetical protein
MSLQQCLINQATTNSAISSKSYRGSNGGPMEVHSHLLFRELYQIQMNYYYSKLLKLNPYNCLLPSYKLGRQCIVIVAATFYHLSCQYTHIPLQRYRFPRPFAVSSLPTKDILKMMMENSACTREYGGCNHYQDVHCWVNGLCN